MMSRNLNLKSFLVNATILANTDVSAGGEANVGASLSSPSDSLASGTYSAPPAAEAAGTRATLGLGRPGEAAQIHEVNAPVAEAVWLLTKTNGGSEGGQRTVARREAVDARPGS